MHHGQQHVGLVSQGYGELYLQAIRRPGVTQAPPKPTTVPTTKPPTPTPPRPPTPTAPTPTPAPTKPTVTTPIRIPPAPPTPRAPTPTPPTTIPSSSKEKIQTTVTTKSSNVASTTIRAPGITQSAKVITSKTTEVKAAATVNPAQKITQSFKPTPSPTTISQVKTKDDAIRAVREGRMTVEQCLSTYKGIVNIYDMISAGLISVGDAIKKGLLNVWDAISRGLISINEAISKGFASIDEAVKRGFMSKPSASTPTQSPPEILKKYVDIAGRFGFRIELYWDEKDKTWRTRGMISQPDLASKIKPKIDKFSAAISQARSLYGYARIIFYDGGIVVWPREKGEPPPPVWTADEAIKYGFKVTGYDVWEDLFTAVEILRSKIDTINDTVSKWAVAKTVHEQLSMLELLERNIREAEQQVPKIESIKNKIRTGAPPTPSPRVGAERFPVSPGATHAEKIGASIEPKSQTVVTDTELIGLKSKKESILKEISQVKADISKFAKAREEARDKIEKFRARINTLVSERNRLAGELTELLSQAEIAPSITREELSARISAVQQEVYSLIAQKSNLESQIRNLRELVEGLRERATAISAQVGIKIRSPGVTQGGYIARSARPVEEKVASTADLSALKKSLTEDIAREESELAGLRASLKSLIDETSALQREVTPLASQVRSIEEEVESLRKRIEEARAVVTSRTPANLSDLQYKLQTLESERDRLLSEIASLNEELSSLSRLRTQLERAVEIPIPTMMDIPVGVTPIPGAPEIPSISVPTTLPGVPEYVPTTPSPEASTLLQQIQNTMQQMANQQYMMSMLQQRAAENPALIAQLQALQAERTMLAQQLQSLQQQLIMMGQQKPQDVGLPVMLMMINALNSQKSSIDNLMPILFMKMLESEDSTRAQEIRMMMEQMEKERQMLLHQIQLLQQQVEQMKEAPPPAKPARPIWYPGMIIMSLLGLAPRYETLYTSEEYY